MFSVSTFTHKTGRVASSSASRSSSLLLIFLLILLLLLHFLLIPFTFILSLVALIFQTHVPVATLVFAVVRHLFGDVDACTFTFSVVIVVVEGVEVIPSSTVCSCFPRLVTLPLSEKSCKKHTTDKRPLENVMLYSEKSQYLERIYFRKCCVLLLLKID